MMNRTQGLLGLCMRAGKLQSGEENALKAIRGGKASLVLLASDVSYNTRKRFTDKAAFYEVPLMVLGLTKAELGASLGGNERSVAVVCDQNFAKLIREANLERN